MFAIISALIGMLSGLLPGIIKIFDQKVQFQHEIELTKLKLEAAARNVELQSQVDEGVSVRNHDATIAGNGVMETLRSSIRPVLTYLFFFLFCGVKITAAWFMFRSGYNGMDVLAAIWDDFTAALFASIMGFWFGNRGLGFMMDKVKGLRAVKGK